MLYVLRSVRTKFTKMEKQQGRYFLLVADIMREYCYITMSWFSVQQVFSNCAHFLNSLMLFGLGVAGCDLRAARDRWVMGWCSLVNVHPPFKKWIHSCNHVWLQFCLVTWGLRQQTHAWMTPAKDRPCTISVLEVKSVSVSQGTVVGLGSCPNNMFHKQLQHQQ